MTSSNRRAFFKTAGVGAAAVGAAALVKPAVSVAGAAAPTAAPAVARPDLALPAAATGSMVAYIQDVSNGQVSVMVEGREVTVTDHQLVAKLAHALHSSSTV